MYMFSSLQNWGICNQSLSILHRPLKVYTTFCVATQENFKFDTDIEHYRL